MAQATNRPGADPSTALGMTVIVIPSARSESRDLHSAHQLTNSPTHQLTNSPTHQLTNSLTRAARRSRPLRDPVPFLVLELARDEHDQIDEHPDPEPTQGDELEDARADLADV